MTRLPTSDVEALVVLLEDMNAESGPAPFTPELLDRMTEFVGCDYASYELVDEVGTEVEYVACSAENDMPPHPSPGGPNHDRVVQYYRKHAGEVVKLTDIFPLRRGRRHFDCPLLEHYAVEDTLAAYLVPPGAYAATVDFQSRGIFSELARARVAALMPHLAARWSKARRALRLEAAIATLEDGRDATGLVILDHDGVIEFASPQAQRLLRDYCGGSRDGLPAPVARWYANDVTRPLALANGAGRLIVQVATAAPSVLILSEQPACVGKLTSREREVMQCVADGLSNAEIARELWLETGTVRKHLEHIYAKLGVGSRTAALAKMRLAR